MQKESVTFNVGGAEIKVEKDALFHAWLAKAMGSAAVNPSSFAAPALNPGERYVGAILSADGSKCDHIILLPGELDGTNWKDAMEWAQSIGGDLPNRCESALLFATMKSHFKSEWYWSCEEHASTRDYAWVQPFGNGGQDCSHKSHEDRACAVRRLKIFS